MKKIFFVIPAYNEAKGIAKVITELKKAGYDNLVVVNDGSIDETSNIAKGSGAIVVNHVINRGQGAALRTGMKYALSEGADVIVHFDADGQHRIEDLPKMLKPVIDGKVDATLGSRFLRKSNLPKNKKIGLKIAVLVNWLLYGIRLSDAHNGFRVLNRKAASKIEIDSDGMEHASEIVEELHRNKLKYKEVPVIIKYPADRKGHNSSPVAWISTGIGLLKNKFLK